MDDAIFYAAFNDELEKVALVGEAVELAKQEGKETWNKIVKPLASGAYSGAKKAKDAAAPVAKRIAAGAKHHASKAGAAIKKKVGPMASDALRQAKTKAGAATMAGALALGGGGGAAVHALKPTPPSKREKTIAKLKRGREREQERGWTDRTFKKELKRQRSRPEATTKPQKELRRKEDIEKMTRAMKDRRIRRAMSRSLPKNVRPKGFK